MNKDKILEMFFEMPRWEYAIKKGIGKDIKKSQLYQLTKPEVRAQMYVAIRDGKYEIAPPHTAKIPKDTPGEFRTVYVNEPIDRVFLSIANDLLYELMPKSIHPRCKSYQKGIGCGKIVKEVAQQVVESKGRVIGWKSDLSKYFDSVPIQFIDKAFDDVEKKHGKSAVIDVLRKYYHSNLYFDTDGKLCETYQSLKQGCAVAAWLANVLLYHIDEKLSKQDGYYIRYSDDMLFIGNDYKKAMGILVSELKKMNMALNPKKVEYLSKSKWFKFLGFNIKGESISLSKTRLKKFQKEIEARTTKNRGVSLKKAQNDVNRFLYKGCGDFSWASQILPVINVEHDINELNKFVMDALRAVHTGKRRIGGLGCVISQDDGCISRGKGRNVKANREKMPKISGYYTITCMRNALLTSVGAYRAIIDVMM